VPDQKDAWASPGPGRHNVGRRDRIGGPPLDRGAGIA